MKNEDRKFICLYRHPGTNDLRVLSLKDTVLSVTLENYGLMKTMIEKLQEDNIIGDASIVEITVYDFIAADLLKRVEVEQMLNDLNQDEKSLRQAITEAANLNPHMMN